MCYNDEELYFYEVFMKPFKQIALFTLSMAILTVIQIVLSAILTVFKDTILDHTVLTLLANYTERLIAVLPPVLTFGVAIGAARRQPLSYSFFFFGIYAVLALMAQVPITLISYSPENSAPYVLILISGFAAALLSVLLVACVFLLTYALFIHGGHAREEGRFFSFRDSGARCLWITAALFALYYLGADVLLIVEHLRENLGILNPEDLFTMPLAVFSAPCLLLFGYAIVRLSERLLPTASPEEYGDEDDSADYMITE